MIDLKKVENINSVIEEYFTQNTSVTIVPAKDLMPAFISAGVFAKDHKNGMPIRKILRELDKTNQLNLIPSIHADRGPHSVYWYFIPSNAEAPTTRYKQEEKNPENKKSMLSRLESDETYVIDLCDIVLEKRANRQKRFDFLLGDLHKDGKSRTKLPVDAYYENLNLVIEYTINQISEPVASLDKEETSSEVSREERKKIYDQRRAEELPKNDIYLVVLSNVDFTCDANNKIIRNQEADMVIVRDRLENYISLKQE
ncbi:MAG: hypothetical protein U9R32_07570 [Bacteroidota bacterium]|nr:hypothetical protein [Bacteroidota bacterium]